MRDRAHTAQGEGCASEDATLKEHLCGWISYSVMGLIHVLIEPVAQQGRGHIACRFGAWGSEGTGELLDEPLAV